MFNIRVNRDKVFTDEDENCGKLAEPVLQLFVVQHDNEFTKFPVLLPHVHEAIQPEDFCFTPFVVM